MPAFLLMLVGALASAAATITGRVLIALGIGYVSYTGIDYVLTGLKADAIANLNSVPLLAIAVMHTMKVDVCISILFSAMAAKLVISGLTSGAVTKAVLR
jgi:hypothetical protein